MHLTRIVVLFAVAGCARQQENDIRFETLGDSAIRFRAHNMRAPRTIVVGCNAHSGVPVQVRSDTAGVIVPRCGRDTVVVTIQAQ